MIKYAKICNQSTKACVVGIGSDQQYYLSQGFQLLDVQQAYNNCWYLAGYAPIQPLDQLKDKCYNQLWRNYKTYQEKYVDAEDLTLASMGSLAGSEKCTAVRDWVMLLWKKYYIKKDQITAAQTNEEIENIDLSANDCGTSPYTIRELNDEFPINN